MYSLEIPSLIALIVAIILAVMMILWASIMVFAGIFYLNFTRKVLRELEATESAYKRLKEQTEKQGTD